MSRSRLHQITIQGKPYIDLIALTDAIKDIYPLKIHSVRRLAKYGRIPYRKVGIGLKPKFWFNLNEVKKALNLVIEDDPHMVDIENYIPDLQLNSDDWSVSEDEDYLEDM